MGDDSLRRELAHAYIEPKIGCPLIGTTVHPEPKARLTGRHKGDDC
jgi:hypothetical protein